MDDFYSSGRPSGKSDNDDFFAGGPSASSASPGFYNSSAGRFSPFLFSPGALTTFLAAQGGAPAAGRAPSNPFDAPAVDFDAEEGRNADDFFAGGVGGAPAGGGGGGSGGAPQGQGRTEGDDKYPWQMGFWRNMFDVDTKEVMMRVLMSLIPFRRGFVDAVRAKPDLWAPFWICSTLIFFMTWTGNFAAYLNSVIANTVWQPKVDLLPWGAMVVYGYWLVVPLVFWGIFRWREVPITLLFCYTVFGYSLFTYIPISIVAIVALGPIQWLSWLLIMLACAYSTITLALSFFFIIKDLDFKPGYVMVLVMAALSVGLGLSFKLYFFAFYAGPVIVPVGNTTALL
jgi:hypothetical protein